MVHMGREYRPRNKFVYAIQWKDGEFSSRPDWLVDALIRGVIFYRPEGPFDCYPTCPWQLQRACVDDQPILITQGDYIILRNDQLEVLSEDAFQAAYEEVRD